MPVIPKTFSATPRFTANPNDVYNTHPLVAKACLEQLKKFSPVIANPAILDPGCGNGVWGHEARILWPKANIYGVDILPEAVITPSLKDYDDVFYEFDYIKEPIVHEYDFIIGNPPFSSKSSRSLALNFVLKSWSALKNTGYIGFLFKTEFVASNTRYNELFKHHAPLNVFQLNPRPYWNGAKGSNTIEYAFFVWQKQENYSYTGEWLNWK